MLPAIARYAMEPYTNAGDVVVHAICGIGTTLAEAVHLGRDALSVEYGSRWAELATANVKLAPSPAATGVGMQNRATAVTS